MSDIEERRLEKKNFSNRLLFIYIFFAFLFTYFLSKTYSLQISSFSDYEIASLKNKTREVLIQPRRGIIYDRNNSDWDIYHKLIDANLWSNSADMIDN